MKTTLVKLPGKNSGFCCKIFIRGMHVATVADPESGTRDAAQKAATTWNKTYRRKLRFE